MLSKAVKAVQGCECMLRPVTLLALQAGATVGASTTMAGEKHHGARVHTGKVSPAHCFDSA